MAWMSSFKWVMKVRPYKHYDSIIYALLLFFFDNICYAIVFGLKVLRLNHIFFLFYNADFFFHDTIIAWKLIFTTLSIKKLSIPNPQVCARLEWIYVKASPCITCFFESSKRSKHLFFLFLIKYFHKARCGLHFGT